MDPDSAKNRPNDVRTVSGDPPAAPRATRRRPTIVRPSEWMRDEAPASGTDRYLVDFRALEPFEANAVEDLRRVEGLDRWEPTAYEERYLPGLRLAGIEDKEGACLQNVADLHMHTQWSDGDDLDRVLAAAQAEQLDVIAITDHDEIEGALEARRRVHERRLKVAVIPGVEVSSKDGHIGALFVTRPIQKGLSAAETVDRIHEAGGLAIAHHPFVPPLIEKLLRVKLGCRDLLHSVPFDAIECTNAVPGYGRAYNMAAWKALRQRSVRIGMTGSSDAHSARLVGKGRTYFAGNRGVRSLHSAIRNGFVHGAEGYWTLSESLHYRWTLAKAIVRNALRRRGSVN